MEQGVADLGTPSRSVRTSAHANALKRHRVRGQRRAIPERRFVGREVSAGKFSRFVGSIVMVSSLRTVRLDCRHAVTESHTGGSRACFRRSVLYSVKTEGVPVRIE